MGSIVEFPSNGSNGAGYFAPAEGGGPGVVVIQEWWGLVPHIEEVCDRIIRRHQRGRFASIVVVAEGALPKEGSVELADREVDRFLDAWRDIASAPHARNAAA